MIESQCQCTVEYVCCFPPGFQSLILNIISFDRFIFLFVVAFLVLLKALLYNPSLL